MKKKNPTLRRNVKISDIDKSLIMDVLTNAGAEWRTIEYEDCKKILLKLRARTESMSVDELEQMVDFGPCGSRKRRRETLLDSSDSNDEADDTIVDLTECDETQNKTKKSSRPSLSFINTNARSLTSKLASLNDCFEEKSLNFATISETWFQDGRDLLELGEDLKAQYSLTHIHRNRDLTASNGRLYGGVAFVFRQSTSNFKKFDLVNPEGHEVLATVGNVAGIRGKIFVLSCYAPPNLSSTKAQEFIECVSDVIGEAKRLFNDCSIIISGEFNQWPLEEILAEHPELSEVNYGPTRGNKSIDRTIVNFGRSITESDTLPPLETDDGRVSDHRIAFAAADFRQPKPKMISYSYKRFTELGATKFVQALSGYDWSSVYRAQTSSAKANLLQSAIDTLMDLCFETKTTTRRECDPP